MFWQTSAAFSSFFPWSLSVLISLSSVNFPSLYPMKSSSLYPPPLTCSYVSWNHWERKTSHSPAAVLLCALMSHSLMWLCCTCECDRKERSDLVVCVRKKRKGEIADNIWVNVTVYSYKNYLYRQKLCDKGEEDHLLTVPHLLAIDFNPTPQLPPLATVLHKDLWRFSQSD